MQSIFGYHFYLYSEKPIIETERFKEDLIRGSLLITKEEAGDKLKVGQTYKLYLIEDEILLSNLIEVVDIETIDGFIFMSYVTLPSLEVKEFSLIDGVAI